VSLRFGVALLAACLLGLGGCATVRNPDPADPLEGWNRGVQTFNDEVDKAVLKPVATAYRDFVPELVRNGVNNFFGNLDDGWSAVNQLLQGKLESALNMTLRVGVNTVFGLAGLLDPASEMGLERQSEDFGQTLGRWGLGPGPYLVLPLLGPSTVRDTAGLPLDMAATSLSQLTDQEARAAWGSALRVVDTRANLLSATRLLDEIALDRYSFLRNAYLARRRNLVWDGNPPEEPEPPEPAEDAASGPR
jgi:phospholipid-binding lipoprotein MlaA